MDFRKKIFLTGLLVLIIVGGFIGSKLTSASSGRPMFTGKENHKVSEREGRELIQNFREEISGGSVVGGFFGKNALVNLLTQPGVVGIRAYFGKEQNGTSTLVLFGVNEHGDDVVEGVAPLASWFPCPPFCPQGDTSGTIIP